VRSLQRDEAVARRDLLTVTGYDVDLDLRDEQTFASRTVIDVDSRGGETFLDLKAVAVSSITLDGTRLPLDGWADGRFPLTLPAGPHRLAVEATMPFRNDGEGLHRATDPADGRTYVYQMSFMSAAPTVFACFDQPDLKAPYTLRVTAPLDWRVIANGVGRQVEPGRWEFATTPPLSTYFVTLVAGPYHRIEEVHDGIPLGLQSRNSLAPALDKDAEEILEITRQCFDEFHRLFGVRYAFGKYDQAFVPEFNAGAMENPGCVTLRDGLLFPNRVGRTSRIQRATMIAHEMAHQWFGNLVTPRWWDDLWLNEAFAEYMGNRVTAEATRYDDALVWASITRKNWGLTADARPSTHAVAGTGATDADAALQDFDGISYAKGHAVLTQLADRVGDQVFLDGVRDHFAQHAFGNATMADLFSAWERAGAGDLSAWTTAWLRTAGLDRIDRVAGDLVRTPPAGPPVDREHRLQVATWDGSTWRRDALVLDAERTPTGVGVDVPLVLDPQDNAWADLTFDDATAAALPGLVAGIDDPQFRATLWITARNGVLHGRLDPDLAVELLCAGLPHEDQDPAVSSLGVWTGDDGEGARSTVHEKLLPLVRDPEMSRARLHRAYFARAATAVPGSDLQLSAIQAAISTAPTTVGLRALLAAEVPDGIVLDSGLRWRVLKRLTSLGDTTRDELDRELAADEDSTAKLAHLWCRARLPEPEAKAWAWTHFTGEADASNYEAEAIGTGFWQADREDLVSPYVARYFDEVPGTALVRAGWALASAAQFFYPITVASPDTLTRADAVIAEPGLDASLRRVLIDATDDLRRRLSVRARFAG
jgi:aminopeptidase N